jgi:hypothetical protein
MTVADTEAIQVDELAREAFAVVTTGTSGGGSRYQQCLKTVKTRLANATEAKAEQACAGIKRARG